MVKMHYKRMLCLGINRQELEHLQQGQPLHIKLDDLDPRMKGQLVVIIPGESDKVLKAAVEEAGRMMQDGRTPDNRIIRVN